MSEETRQFLARASVVAEQLRNKLDFEFIPHDRAPHGLVTLNHHYYRVAESDAGGRVLNEDGVVEMRAMVPNFVHDQSDPFGATFPVFSQAQWEEICRLACEDVRQRFRAKATALELHDYMVIFGLRTLEVMRRENPNIDLIRF